MLLSPRGIRLATAFASLLLLSGAVAACGAGADSPAAPSAAGSSAAAPESGAFPVTIENKFGSVTIASEPKRIVTVGLTDQDAVLALGKVPVGTTDWLGGYKGAIGPWATGKLGTAAEPTMLTDTGTGPQVEKIAALAPDLILALYSGLTKEQYETLSKLAPVVAQPKEYNDYGIPWQTQTEIIGRALGKEAEGRKLVEDVTATFTAARRAPRVRGGRRPGGHAVRGILRLRQSGLALAHPHLPRLHAAGRPRHGHRRQVRRRHQQGARRPARPKAIVWIVPDTAKDPATLPRTSSTRT